MPQDTTIYWNGEGQLPALIDSLPLEQQQILLHQVHDKIDQENYDSSIMPYTVVGLFGIFFIVAMVFFNKKNKQPALEEPAPAEEPRMAEEAASYPVHTYSRNELNFSIQELSSMLLKHSVYFSALNPFDKEKFIQRVRKFIPQICFVIHGENCLKEMPVLVSAAAIQLTFGLEKYLLPNFEYIQIFPEEFIGIHPTIRVLEGNVCGNTISLSWKHFLAGFQFPYDGQNVGLHEMAHAYYFQFFEADRKHADDGFVSAFPAFNNWGNKVFEEEAKPGFDLYSDYALRNFQEFWAESIEIFFEKPGDMKAQYPDLYFSICALLNQYPVRIT